MDDIFDERKKREEKKYENKFIAVCRAHSLKADHVDSSVDGQPDVLILGDRAVFVEMKYCSPLDEILSVMEPTQIVWMMKAREAGFLDDYILIYDPSIDIYILFQLLVPRFLMECPKATFRDLMISKSGTADEIVEFLFPRKQ